MLPGLGLLGRETRRVETTVRGHIQYLRHRHKRTQQVTLVT
jgi:hypothetical protein